MHYHYVISYGRTSKTIVTEKLLLHPLLHLYFTQ